MTGAPKYTSPEYYDLWGWLNMKPVHVGQARHTERGTLFIQVSPHIDKTKLYTMMTAGVEIKRSKREPVYHSAADEYAA